MQGAKPAKSQRSSANSLLLSNKLRPFREQSESDLPFVPFVGGPRMFILLLYASVIVVPAIEYFVSPRLWPGTWEIYNFYVRTNVLARIACHSVIRAGRMMEWQEMEALLEQLDEKPGLLSCPHGRPVTISWSLHEIEKKFHR